jgi:hypothetical protein
MPVFLFCVQNGLACLLIIASCSVASISLTGLRWTAPYLSQGQGWILDRDPKSSAGTEYRPEIMYAYGVLRTPYTSVTV